MTYQDVLGALADPTRRAILEELHRQPRSVGSLAGSVPVSRPAVSQHLRVLKEARLVRERREGTRHIYSPDPAGLAELRQYLDRFWAETLEAFERAAREEKGGPND